MRPSSRRRLGLLLALLAGTACGGNPDRPIAPTGPSADREESSRVHGRAALAAVRAGNEQSILAAPALVPAGAPLAPFIEARLYAIANVAMHDALNSVTPRYSRYSDGGAIDDHANAAAAVLTAAHDAIVGAAPGATAATDAWYATAISALTGSEGLAQGIAIGHRAATAILARRATDGVAAGGVAPYVPGSGPGDYRFTFPFNTPAFDFFGTGGFADGSNWAGTVTPFVIRSASQFRAPPPYGAASNATAVLTPRYTADFIEVKALGCTGCAARSATQTEIALFWRENSPTGWNRVARAVADARHLDAAETARLFALVQMGEFDAYLASLESKYHYDFWRPVSAVALAGTDGNPLTSSASGWQVLAVPTPPIPDYPSGHSTAGGNAAAILEELGVGRVQFATTSRSLAGVMRSFASVGAAARENADSRVFIGYHFRHATDVGLAQGRAVGRYVAGHALRPLDEGGH
jgi:hypothetical protein